MVLKIPVEDRVSTYPGRIKLTPVSGESNVYDMSRADVPINEGTPVNKALFDNKAYTLTGDVTIHVDTYGNDSTGDGSTDLPFRTIQKAINAIPKHLGGHTATISVTNGTYSERVEIKDFTSGKLVVCTPGSSVIINGIDIINSSVVETNIYKIQRNSNNTGALYSVKDGSNVAIASPMTLDGNDRTVVGLAAERNSSVITGNNITVTANNCVATVSAVWCSFVTLSAITGSNNVLGLSASQGSIISYKTDTTTKDWSNAADSGGLVLTGQNSSDLSDATLDL